MRPAAPAEHRSDPPTATPEPASNGRPTSLRTIAARMRRRLQRTLSRRGFGKLDRPASNENSYAVLGEVDGWWLFPTGAARGGRVVIDGQVVAMLETGRIREDVARGHPEIANARASGFHGHWIPRPDPDGRPMRMSVVLEDQEGRAHEIASRTLFASHELRGNIDRIPGRNGADDVCGWAFFDDGGVEEVWATWNDVPVARLTTGIHRPDVLQVHPSYPWAEFSGFSGRAFLVGNGRLGIVALGRGGRRATLRSVPVDLPLSGSGVGDLDEPVEGVSLEAEEIRIRGWWIFPAGPPRSGQVFIDDRPVMPIDIGIERPDVAGWIRTGALAAHAPSCGFQAYWKPDPTLAPGEHQVRVRLESPGGSEIWIGPRIVRLHPIQRGAVTHWPTVEEPGVEGWGVFDRGPVQRAFLCVSGQRTLELAIGRPTPDVLDGFSDKPWAKQAGFGGELPGDRDWSRSEVSVLLIGPSGQERVLGPRPPLDRPVGECGVAGYGAAFDPLIPAEAGCAWSVTGWAHRFGKRLARLWIVAPDGSRWECETRLPRGELFTSEPLGFRALIPEHIFVPKMPTAQTGAVMRLQAETDLGPIDLLNSSLDEVLQQCHAIIAGGFRVRWTRTGNRFGIEFRATAPVKEAPRLSVNCVDVTRRIQPSSEMPGVWRYDLAVDRLPSRSLELALPDGANQVRATVRFASADDRLNLPDRGTECVLLAGVDGRRHLWVVHRATTTSPVEIVATTEDGRVCGGGALRRAACSISNGAQVFVGLFPLEDATHVNVRDAAGVTTLRIPNRPIRLEPCSNRDFAIQLPGDSLTPASDSPVCWLLLGPAAHQREAVIAAAAAAEQTRACRLRTLIFAAQESVSALQKWVESLVGAIDSVRVESYDGSSALAPWTTGDIVLPLNRPGLSHVDAQTLDRLTIAFQSDEVVDVIVSDDAVRRTADRRLQPIRHRPFDAVSHALGRPDLGPSIAFRFGAFDPSGWCHAFCEDDAIADCMNEALPRDGGIRHLPGVLFGFDAPPQPFDGHRASTVSAAELASDAEVSSATLIIRHAVDLTDSHRESLIRWVEELASATHCSIHLVGPWTKTCPTSMERHACDADQIDSTICEIIRQSTHDFIVLVDAAAQPPTGDWLSAWLAHFSIPGVAIVGLRARDARDCPRTPIWSMGPIGPVETKDRDGSQTQGCLLPDPALIAFRRSVWTQTGGLDTSLPPRFCWIDFALAARHLGTKAIVAADPVFSWSGDAPRHSTATAPGPAELRAWRALLRQHSVNDTPSPQPRLDDLGIASHTSMTVAVPPRRGRGILFWSPKEQRPAGVDRMFDVIDHLRAMGWRCRVVAFPDTAAAAALGARDASHDGIILNDSEPGRDRPFGDWEPDVIQATGTALVDVCDRYDGVTAPIVARVDDDELLLRTAGDPSRWAHATKRISARVTTSCRRYLDLCALFGAEKTYLFDSVVAGQSSTDAAQSGTDGIVVFLNPSDPIQSNLLLESLRRFTNADERGRLFVVPTVVEEPAVINAFHLACAAIKTSFQVELLSSRRWASAIEEADCLTWLDSDAAPFEIDLAASLGLWIISASPCDRLEDGPCQGATLSAPESDHLVDAWRCRPRGRADSSHPLTLVSAEAEAAELDRLYRQLLIGEHACDG